MFYKNYFRYIIFTNSAIFKDIINWCNVMNMNNEFVSFSSAFNFTWFDFEFASNINYITCF